MIRREIWRQEKWKDFGNPHLGVSDVDFDPENGSRMAQVAKSVMWSISVCSREEIR